MKKFFIVLSLLLCLGTLVFAQDTKLKILEQPKPELPQNFGTLDVQGTIIFKVQFLEFGEIGEVTIVQSLPPALMEKAMAAARKIKFEPEKKDGKAVTVVKTIQYSYSWNGGWLSPADSTAGITPPKFEPGKAEEVIQKAIKAMGGSNYLQIKTQIGRGKFSTIREGSVLSFQTFTDAIIFPDRERTEFKGAGSRTVQVNTGDTGWVYDGDQDIIRVQNAGQIANFKQGIKTSLDNLLRGYWKGDAELSYLGKRPATLGKRNDVVKLTYKDGFAIEFEFASDDGLPQKAKYKTSSSDGEEITEEDRYAQFLDIGGIRTPYVIDKFIGGKPASRINYETIDYNKNIPDSIFAKPTATKELKKDMKLP